MSLRVCLEIWGADPRRLVEIARHAETAGLDGVYLGESPTPLNAETRTTLGAIAASTSRIRLGPVLANLLPGYRSPVLLARQGGALAALSDGRFDFRTGVGADRRHGGRWWEPAGVRYPAYADRLAEAERQLTIIGALWRGESVTLDGDRYSLDIEHPPIEITVAARGERALALADRHAHRWETSHVTASRWVSQAEAAPPALCSSLEIDGFLGPRRVVLDRLVRDRPTEDHEALLERALVGEPAEVADQLDRLESAGLDQVVVALHDPGDGDAITALGEAVAITRD